MGTKTLQNRFFISLIILCGLFTLAGCDQNGGENGDSDTQIDTGARITMGPANE